MKGCLVLPYSADNIRFRDVFFFFFFFNFFLGWGGGGGEDGGGVKYGFYTLYVKIDFCSKPLRAR